MPFRLGDFLGLAALPHPVRKGCAFPVGDYPGLAALPHPVRKGCAFPMITLLVLGYAFLLFHRISAMSISNGSSSSMHFFQQRTLDHR